MDATNITTSNYQGKGVLASEEDKIRDVNGFTNPNLHRRVELHAPDPLSKELKPRTYKFNRHSVYESQLMEQHYHDEENNESEIP